MSAFQFDLVAMPQEAEDARSDIRAFLEDELKKKRFEPHLCTWSSFDPEFSKRLGQAGFIGMTWPAEHGGKNASMLTRFVITEELLAAGSPCGAHWIADRQSGPQILRHGSPRAKAEILPRIVAGECYFGIGMSEPGAGSDLAAVKTRATKVDGGWSISGQKIWTTNAHLVNYMIVLARTGDAGPSRHEGLTQFIVDMSSDGVTPRGITDLAGNHEFNEVFFDECFVPDDMVVGEVGEGWSLVTGELAFERSTPDRFLTDYQLFRALVDRIGPEPDRGQAVQIGEMVAELASLRRMSISISGMLDRGDQPVVQAAMVKDLGTAFERSVPEIARVMVAVEPTRQTDDPFVEAMAETVLRAPSFTLRGGTREILKSMIARGLDLR
ncbi:acyl-CoA dehydrogenase family protein (plasmid) [Sulfitobacter pontiacus]|uniref:acyl-CoA dehydrogenase family protein n=1 Tax=Sulfitobacter pontiacus TaxID=60137 RepID=UPI002AC8E52A|nr:acyl-CoA dehydrogenase family protein [Sulfitobacter pontiacus]WPZ27584.1 acyl-CoA dehydrogenase family protein [Sulfitobacter pontiacus]